MNFLWIHFLKCHSLIFFILSVKIMLNMAIFITQFLLHFAALSKPFLYFLLSDRRHVVLSTEKKNCVDLGIYNGKFSRCGLTGNTASLVLYYVACLLCIVPFPISHCYSQLRMGFILFRVICCFLQMYTPIHYFPHKY